jgi:hypothetical protein
LLDKIFFETYQLPVPEQEQKEMLRKNVIKLIKEHFYG